MLTALNGWLLGLHKDFATSHFFFRPSGRFQDGARYTIIVSYPSVERQLLEFLQSIGAPLTPGARQVLAGPAA